MYKKYIVRLSDEERGVCQDIIKRLKGSSQKVKRAQILLRADVEGPAWTDAKIAAAHGCSIRMVENVREQVQKREAEEEQNRKKFELPPYLKHFGVSLNRLARADKIAPTIGREKEIQQIIEILCHRERANSPMLVGEPGVGKTAVIEGLARLIELEPERVPARLRNSHIVQLQMGGLVAGTMLRGMFEDRIQNVIREVKERPNLILFVDEAHTLVGAGSALGAPSDAANVFKSVLARGEILAEGTYAEVSKNPQVVEAYMGTGHA